MSDLSMHLSSLNDIKNFKAGCRQTAQEMDDERQQNTAYEYLCHLEEAKIWMETVLKEPLPPSVELEENLRNGVFLAKIGNFISPNVVPLSRIYDIFQHRYRNLGLQFRHTDNINYFIESLKSVGFPKTFLFETTDVYDKKNMPKLVYCIHALSAHLFRLGQAPIIEDLYGKVKFTKQEIDMISSEIKKNSITLPLFKKIGGLLSEELTTDAASLHSGIININKAIDEESEESLLKALNDNSVALAQVIPEYVSHYLKTFRDIKKEKLQAAQNRSLNKSSEPDIYDELLNQSEIQGHIRKVNIDCVWQDILNSIRKKKRENVQEIIAASFADIKNFTPQNISHYVDEALSLDLNQAASYKSRDTIQTIIRNGNRNAKEHCRVLDAVARVKSAVLSGNKEKLLTTLRSPSLKLASHITDFAAPLYLEEMKADLKMSESFCYKDIKSSVFVLNDIAKITSIVDSWDLNATWTQLSSSEIPFMNLDPALKSQYFKALFACRQEKLTQDVENHLLTFVDIQECIDMANINDLQQTRAVIHLKEINEAVQAGNTESLKLAMEGVVPGEISSEDAGLCLQLLKKCLARKQQNSDEELWLDDVMSVVEEIRRLTQKAEQLCEHFYRKFTPSSHSENVLKSIENYDKRILHPSNETSKPPIKNLRPHPWLMCNLDEDIRLYINWEKKTYKWANSGEINCEKISTVTVDNLKENKDDVGIKKNLDVQRFTRLQAIIRGFLLRRNIEKKLRAILVIQRWWRRVRRRLKHNSSETEERSVQLDPNHFRDIVDKVTKIQALWRGYWCRKNLALKKSASLPCNPSFQYLKCLSYSRRLNSHDYSTDLKVQAMKSCVVETIKRNQELSRRLEEMDMKIGLLVQNRMSVEAIVAENKKLQNVHVSGCESRGIKAFSKEAKRLLDGYQKLFYLLQTDPSYLTRLIVRLPLRPNHVIQSCVLSLFNYGSSTRDAYLLLRLFRIALFEEVRYTFQKPVDAVTGNPLVLKLAVSFARQVEGHNPLRNILGFLIEKVLNDKVILDTNPVDIYRRWVNQMEMESGRRSELSPVVTVEEALTYPEVVSRLNHNIRILKSWVKCFLDRLTQCVNQFPYSLRFIAKLLKSALLQKFPQTPEKDILKIVGNIVYYQYINSAIVAPDAFYIISLPPDQHLKVEQRRNLASIAKILHFAATKKGFGEESKHLMSLNPFIVECHEEMKKFCRNCCAVDDLEEHFRITKYSEAALIDKPRIYITLEEIRECHKLLCEVSQEVAPDPLDPIHEILEELGPPPSLAILIGCSDASDGTLSRAGKIQVCLELDNKFHIPPENPTEAEKLFIKTKELISKRLGELNGETLTEAIRDPKHADIATNLAKLELAGVVKSSNDYETILKSLIQDVSDKQEYRRALNQEITVLRTAQQRLNEKRKFYEDQLSYYEQYLKTCLNNLKASSNKTKQKKGQSVRYSGTRLRDKGVLIALNGVPPNQLRNVQFEISTTPFSGIYSVQGRFMGVEVEKIDIDIQELLRLQFEGNREMDLFGKAQINVNLLLHLLNKKFLGRT